GFGVRPKVDFPSASAGLVPTDTWKYNTFKNTVRNTSENLCDLHICPGDLINMAIGQGDLRVTPLQMATAYSAIDNGGSLCQPHFGMQIQSPDGKVVRQIEPDCSQKIPYTAPQLDYIKRALAGVPTQGTAAPAFVNFPFSQVAVA